MLWSLEKATELILLPVLISDADVDRLLNIKVFIIIDMNIITSL